MTLRLIENPVPWPDGARCAVAITFDIVLPPYICAT